MLFGWFPGERLSVWVGDESFEGEMGEFGGALDAGFPSCRIYRCGTCVPRRLAPAPLS